MNVVAFPSRPALGRVLRRILYRCRSGRSDSLCASEGRLLTAGATLRRDVRGDRGGGVVRHWGEWCSATASSKPRSSALLTARQDLDHASSSPAIRRVTPTMPACDGRAKKTASAARTSKAPVASRVDREALFDGVSRPNRSNRFSAARLSRWLLDRVRRSPRRSALVEGELSNRSSRSTNASFSSSRAQTSLRIPSSTS
jgi:hypothetical protein